MNLLDKQIKAVQATLEQVIGEYEEGKKQHHWKIHKCPLCQVEPKGCANVGCPIMGRLGKGCSSMAYEFGYDNDIDTPLQDIAGFLTSLLISLKELT